MTRDRPASPGAQSQARVRKPKALASGARVAVFAPASPGSETRVAAGVAELRRLGFVAEMPAPRQVEGYFAAGAEARRAEFVNLLNDRGVDALIGTRGGYGSNYLLDASLASAVGEPKVVIGFSDLTSLQIFLWQRCHWVTLYGPMAAAGFDAGAGAPGGDAEGSLRTSISEVGAGWKVSLRGGALVDGEAEGRLLGGAL